MTGSEMISTFLQYYDRVTSFSAPGYITSEILTFLNNAQIEFVKDRTFGKNFQPPAFEDNQKRVADLFPLVYNITTGAPATLPASTVYGNSWAFDTTGLVAHNPLYYIKLAARVTRTNYPVISNDWMECDLIKNEFADKYIINAANRTHFINPKWLQSGVYLYIIGDNYVNALSQIKLTFIRKPYPITSTIGEFDGTYGSTKMSLHSSVHQEIVDIAIRQALQVTDDRRYPSQLQEEKIKDN